MSATKTMTHPEARQHLNRRFWRSGPPFVLGDMAYLILIAIAAALLTGILALPVTMPGQLAATLGAMPDAAGTGLSLTAQAARS